MLEIVIKIPEEIYKNIQSETFWLESGLTLSNAYDFIRNGTPIPKGHGELKDVNEIWRLYDYNDIDYTMIDALNDAETVIEEDKS